MFYISPLHKSMLSILDQVEPTFQEDQDYLVTENEDSLILELQLPGFEKDKISIIRTGQELAISAERERRGKKVQVSRAFTIPSRYDIEAIEAEYKNGILLITAKKREAYKTRRIEIK